jgi:PAS domain-containing protein
MTPAKALSSVSARGTERLQPAPPRVVSAPVTADNSELSQLRTTLRQLQSFNQALLSTISDLIFEIRKDGVVTAFHGSLENEFAITTDAVVGKRLMELLPTQIGQLAMHYLEKTLRTRTPQKFACQYPFLDDSAISKPGWR